MKIRGRGIIFFIVLMLALSAIVSYLALNHVSQANGDAEEQKMTVALVNEDEGATLYNPVQVKSDGVISGRNTLASYFLILTTFIAALFTAYVIATYDQSRLTHQRLDEEKRSWMRKNTLITAITIGFGVIEGLLIGILSGYLLRIAREKLLVWICLIVLIILAFLLLATYLLRQLKMVGMLVLLVVFSMFLFLTNAPGFDFDSVSYAAKLRAFSPLQYTEAMLSGFMHGNTDLKPFLILLSMVLVSLVANLFVFRSKEKDEDRLQV